MFYRCCHLASSDKQLLVPLGHNSQVNIIPKYANVDCSFIVLGEKTF